MVEPGATIKGRAFGYCYQLHHVVCGGGTYLEKYAFEYCRKLKQAILCRDVAVEEGAFERKVGKAESLVDHENRSRVLEYADGVSGLDVLPACVGVEAV